MIAGYKSFDENWKNIYGTQMIEGKTYKVDGDIRYGVKGNGYHFAKNLEDTLRYQLKDGIGLVEPMIAQVVGDGKIVESFDHYYGYYDLYAAEIITIKKLLTREEIIDYALKLYEQRMLRFVSLFRLTEEEIKLFEGKYPSVDKAILYHQKGILNVYELEYKKNKQLIKN